MPDYYFDPALSIADVTVGSREVVSAPTATTAFVGYAQAGPLDNPITIESAAAYQATFGKISAAQPLSTGIEDYFLNGGRKAVIVRARSDGRRGAADALIGNAKAKTGLHALARVEERLGLLVIPDAGFLSEKDAALVMKAAVSYAEAHGIFFIADVPNTVTSNGHDAAVRWSAGLARSRNMAIYHPWVARAVGSGSKKTIRPPSPMAAGIYARLDQSSGVWKAPTGQEATAVGGIRLAHTVTEDHTEKLSSASINPVRKITGNRIVLWGARTFAPAGDNEWKYVNVRRFALFLEHSIQDSLSWAVFEPNAEPLWAQIRLEVSAFLYTAWRAGALQGVTPKDAYFVKCDATTMTQNDIDNGNVNVMIGIAPVRPAEFVIIRIGFQAAQETDP
jgi:phage tail sheath protein FI